MAKNQRLPEAPLFGPLAKTEQDDLETKKVWEQRLLYLLDTPLANIDLANIAEIEELKELYAIDGMTLSDLIHLQQILKAARGDTKAYSAISKVAEKQVDKRNTNDKLIDPVVKLTEMLYYATKEARTVEIIDAEFEDMFGDYNDSTIIEVELRGPEEDEIDEDKE